jgi:hypothetical protein
VDFACPSILSGGVAQSIMAAVAKMAAQAFDKAQFKKTITCKLYLYRFYIYIYRYIIYYEKLVNNAITPTE